MPLRRPWLFDSIVLGHCARQSPYRPVVPPQSGPSVPVPGARCPMRTAGRHSIPLFGVIVLRRLAAFVPGSPAEDSILPLLHYVSQSGLPGPIARIGLPARFLHIVPADPFANDPKTRVRPAALRSEAVTGQSVLLCRFSVAVVRLQRLVACLQLP